MTERTHWKDCHLEHHDCALAKIEELEAKLAVTEKALLMASGYASANPQDAYDNFISEAMKDE